MVLFGDVKSTSQLLHASRHLCGHRSVVRNYGVMHYELNVEICLMDEYVERTSLYAQHTIQITCMLNVQASTPCVLSQEGFAFGLRFSLRFWAWAFKFLMANLSSSVLD